jgi:hypothetical protein
VPTGRQTVVGGDEDGPGYTLTNDEASRIRTGRLLIVAPVTGTDPARDPDVVIRDLTLSATLTSQSPGAINALEIVVTTSTGSSAGIGPAAVAPGTGIARVEGDVLIANADETSGIAIQASGLIRLVTPNGSLRVQNAGGNPTGEISLASANIWAASQELLDQLAADSNFAGRNDALLQNDGDEQPRGYIEAGNVSLFVGDTLFVQNSGTADSFAGITVTGDLTISPIGSAPLEVQAFGRRLNPDGSFTDNSDFFATINFETGYGGGFTQAAQFNLCVIATGLCPGGTPEEEPIQPPTQDQVTEPVEGSNEDSVTEVVNVNEEFDDNSVFDTNELIEEPVTSGGDVSAWEGCDEPGGDRSKCEGDRPARNGNGGGANGN